MTEGAEDRPAVTGPGIAPGSTRDDPPGIHRETNPEAHGPPVPHGRGGEPGYMLPGHIKAYAARLRRRRFAVMVSDVAGNEMPARDPMLRG
jgi:hypothetical protein